MDIEKENMHKDREVAKNLADNIWYFFDLLRDVRLSPYENHIILFLLSLYNDEILNESLWNKKNGLVEELKIALSKKNDYKSKVYRDIFPYYENTFRKLGDKGLAEMESVIAGAVPLIEDLNEYFPDVFDFTLHNIVKSQGKKGGEYILPYEISQFMCELANVNSTIKVYNPFAGVASLGIYLNKKVQYFGQELSQEIWIIGKLRLLAHNQLKDSEYINDDSIENWNPSGELFDLIISNPPFNLSKSWNLNNSYEDFTIDFLNVGLSSINDKGQIIALVSQKFLFESRAKTFRKELIDNDSLEMLVSVPSGLLQNTNIPSLIIKINKDKANKGYIQLVDANDYITEKNSIDKRLRIKELISLIDKAEDSNNFKNVSSELIRKNDYNLNIPLYLSKEFTGDELENFLTAVKVQGVDYLQPVKYIRIRDLSTNFLDYKLAADEISEQHVKFRINEVNESCILLALRWKSLKPTYFEYSGTPIYISSDILAVKITNENIDLEYLIQELHSERIKEQVNAYSLGGTSIPRLRKQDFFRIRIEVPSFKEQQQTVMNLKKEIFFHEEVRLAKLKKEISLDISEQNSLLRHQIAGRLKNVRSSVEKVKKILNKHLSDSVPELYELKYTENSRLTLGKYFEMLERDLNSIKNSTQKSGKSIEIEISDVKEIDVVDFISDYFKELESDNTHYFSSRLALYGDFEESDDFQEEGNVTFFGKITKKAFIKGDPDLISKAFDNIIENAVKHAFNKTLSIKNLLTIRAIADFEKMTFLISFSNSGNPLPEDFVLEKYIKKGEKSGDNCGDGTGLWLVNEIMKKHGGYLNCYGESDSDESIREEISTFELIFPIEIKEL